MQYLLAALLTIADKHNFDLSEKTIGIVGVGNVGSKVQAAARILGMNVKICDPPRARSEGNAGFVTFDEIVRSCNIITLHVPLVAKGEDKTYHLFDKGVFEKIKKETWLINSSRGEVIETRAINDAMNAGLLKGAILDVWENEPDIDIELLRRVFISTPHIAGYSTDGKANGTSQVVRALSDFFGLPPVNFYPQSLQPPLVPDILIDGAQKSTIQIIVQAVLHTYPIMDDHLLLQNSPETFEQQRGNYPLRREFTAFTVRLSNANPESTEALRKLGFIVLKS